MELDNLQLFIADWNREALPDRTILQAAKKLLEEASECHVAAKDMTNGHGDCSIVMREVADVAILCFVLANLADTQLEGWILEKLDTLRRRMHEQPQRNQEREGV